MCQHCNYYQRSLGARCLDRRAGPSTTPPARPVQLAVYPASGGYFAASAGTASVPRHVSQAGRAPSTRTTGSNRSTASQASQKHIERAEAIVENSSLLALANQISNELHGHTATGQGLRAWLNSVDPNAYRRTSWTSEVQAAYESYKSHGDSIQPRRKEWHTYSTRIRKDPSHTPDQRTECGRLALRWAQTAAVAAEARLAFLRAYRSVYKDTTSIENHIHTAEDYINSGRNAIREARINYDKRVELERQLQDNDFD